MLSLNAIGIATTVLVAAGASTVAHAAPFTFQFNMPAWSYTPLPSLFGTNAVLDITVDNGGGSDASQSYSFLDVQQVSVVASGGGSFSASWSASQIIKDSDPSFIFLPTDGFGVPTLDLLPQPLNYAFILYDPLGSDYALLLAIPTPSSEVYPLFEVQSQNNNFPGAAYVNGASSCAYFCGISVSGSLVSSSDVPESSTIAVFGAALIGLGAMRRRTRKSPELAPAS